MNKSKNKSNHLEVAVHVGTNVACFEGSALTKDTVRAILLYIKGFFLTAGRTQSFIRVHILNREEMRRVNKLLRGKNEPTNIISVPFSSFFTEAVGTKEVGELYLCPEVIADRKESLIDLVIHGFAHLEGYTHNASRDTLLMQQREKELAASINRYSSVKKK